MKRPKTLKPILANSGLTAEYRNHLNKMINRMHDSYGHWLEQSYPNDLASDAPNDLDRTLRALARYWLRRFGDMASPLAGYFNRSINRRTEARLKRVLKDAGFDVDFEPTDPIRNIIRESIKENVSLIRSIPKQYHKQVRELVGDAVVKGRSHADLTKDLQRQFDITRDRAALIARDQNNKINAAMQRARCMELGINKAIWMHSHMGKVPRPSHVRNHGKAYDVAKGWYDPNEKKRIWPGMLINCRCLSRFVVPGLMKE
jgi:SPP1 gp7 family putative phage head morphogenesis protein